MSEAWQLAIMAILAAVLAASNPNEQQFASYIRSNQGFFERLACKPRQTANYFLLSRYEIDCNEYQKAEYVGVLGNFLFWRVNEDW